MSPEFALSSSVASHTSTNEWQSFELRMRRRRADRCLLRASAALDADVPDAAKEVLEEARALCPEHPELQDVTARLLSVSDVLDVPAAAPERRPAPAWAAAALVCVLSWAAAWGGAVWAGTPEGAAVLHHLATAATSAATYVVRSAASVAGSSTAPERP